MMVTSPFASDQCALCCSTVIQATGQIKQTLDEVRLDLPPDASMVTVQIANIGTGFLDFQVTLDQQTWMSARMFRIPDGDAFFSVNVNGLFQGGVAGMAAFRVIALGSYTGSFADITIRAAAATFDPGTIVNSVPIVWTKIPVILNGAANQTLVSPAVGRRGLILYSPLANAEAWYDITGGNVVPDQAILLAPGAQPTIFDFPSCGTQRITVTGTSGDTIITYVGA